MVCPAFSHNVNDGPGVTAKFRQEVGCDYAEFLCGVWVERRNPPSDARHLGIVVVHPIKQEIIIPLPLPVHRKAPQARVADRKSTRLNSSHLGISYAVF